MVSTDEQARAAWPWLRAGLAAALCFHILGNATLAGVGGSVLGGGAAASVLAFPKARWPLAALAVAAAGLYWHEAPIVGNHLLLLAAIAVAVAAESALRPEPARALAAARLGVLVFYGFAAFAKLNEGFFDPETSCAPFYLNESADSLGLPNLASTTGARWAAILLTVAIEASIPILLLVRRTRTFGVMLALGFHAVVALDRTHQFFDFSAVLSAVFVTFLPAAILVDAQQRLGRAVPARVVRVGAPAAALLAGLIGAVAADRADHRLALDAGWLAWQLLAVVVGVAIVGSLRAHRGIGSADVALRPGPSLLVIALVAVNGALPYMEIKTATGWNMYANLRIVDGDSNHFVVRASFPITDPQDDLVTIVSTDEPFLQPYIDANLLLPVRTLRAFLQQHPEGVDAVLEIEGERLVLERGDPVPERLGPPVPEWVRRLFVLRAVSTAGDVPCQDAFFAAT
jgi:hypothetical protein